MNILISSLKKLSLGFQKSVLFVTSECSDFIQAGGLGEVSASLPRALQKKQIDVRLVLPGYSQVLERSTHLQKLGWIPGFNTIPPCQLAITYSQDGLPVYVVLNSFLFERKGGPYTDQNGIPYQDNGLRFATLSWVASQIAKGLEWLKWKPNLVHLHDWPAALTAAYLHWHHIACPSLLTIHNLAYQGLIPWEEGESLGIPIEDRNAEFYNQWSFLKAGLVYSTKISTVSPNYAKQILTSEFGCGLEGVLQERSNHGDLLGIINGIDDSWNPTTTPTLAHTYSAMEISKRILNKKYLQTLFNLPIRSQPLFSVVSRLVHQKGIDLIEKIIRPLAETGSQLIILGEGDFKIQKQLYEQAWQFPGSIRLEFKFTPNLAKHVFSGSDFLLMPSRFEPCGLSQMYAQRFGCIPVAYATGGLVDTIEHQETGLLFNVLSESGLRKGIIDSFQIFNDSPRLQRIQKTAMEKQWGWDKSSQEYCQLYQKLSP